MLLAPSDSSSSWTDCRGHSLQWDDEAAAAAVAAGAEGAGDAAAVVAGKTRDESNDRMARTDVVSTPKSCGLGTTKVAFMKTANVWRHSTNRSCGK